MSWNKPSSAPQPPPKKSAPPSLKRGLIAGLVVIAVASACVFMFSGGDTKSRVKSDKMPARIRDVKPAAVRTNRVFEASEEKPKLTKDQEMLKMLRERYGNNIPESLKHIVYHLEHPPKKGFQVRGSPHDYFNHRCEREIASMLKVEPGELLVVQPTFDERFDEAFRTAAVEKIKINEDDPEDVKELKRAVQETKEELCKRVAAGERASEIMNREGRALYELGMYRENLESEIARIRYDPNASDDDVRDFVAAANMMLKAKGAKTFAEPTFIFRSVMLSRVKNRVQNGEKETENKK